MGITKMAYHQPRPYMVNPAINVFGCDPEYGNPSGHSIFAAAFNIFFYLDVFHAQENENVVRGVSWKIGRGIAFFIVPSLTLLIGFARFYVGVHTLNQIVYGWLWGIWLGFYFHFCIREPTIAHVESILLNEG